MADPDLELRGQGVEEGGYVLLALLASLSSVIFFFFFTENKGGAWAPPLDPPLDCDGIQIFRCQGPFQLKILSGRW